MEGRAAIELKELVVCDTDNNNVNQTIEVIPGNGVYQPGLGTDEVSHLLQEPQVAAHNREQHTVDGVDRDIDSPTETSKWRRELQSLKADLNEVVVWKLRLWMVIFLIFFVITLVIGISIIVCLVSDDDGDENYEKSSFVVERFFNGNFTLDNSSFTLFPLDREALLEQLEQQITEVYSSSPALERYFSNVTVNSFQNTTAKFKLQFMMPLEHEELVRYTLSLKMVKNVLRQHLYDQEPPYIIPTSLRMEVG
ncbi:TPA-induced transmembrane protein [Pseudorasbora parva]|uniref:TPA-induced transmembrane protein n=1 Tax=Pseudorasbora parva TaxID=51549 RepID=UPI00351E3FD7